MFYRSSLAERIILKIPSVIIEIQPFGDSGYTKGGYDKCLVETKTKQIG
jgi:hypothetical protein